MHRAAASHPRDYSVAEPLQQKDTTVPERRRRGRPRREEARKEPCARIVWRNGRGYGEFRAWTPWGGRMEALVPDGRRFATCCEQTAATLFDHRLQELRELRRAHPDGLPRRELDQVVRYAHYHVDVLATDPGRRKLTTAYLSNTRHRLAVATAFLGRRGVVYLRQITAAHVQAFLEHLRTLSPSSHDHRKRLTPATQRQYIDSLGHMLQRAVSEGRIPRNWVRERIDLPMPGPSTTELLELGECALLLESARRLFPPHQPGTPVYPLLAFLLFTGCIESERAGLELGDIRLPGDLIYPRGVVLIRPNSRRSHLKSLHRERLIPMQPQLAEILAEYLTGPNAPPGPLLFSEPGQGGKRSVGDWRRSLDEIARGAGFAPGEVRTRRFRVAFATHRLSTLDEHGHPMSAWKLRGEMGHSTEQMIEKRYGRYARYRGSRPVLEYRWDEWKDRYAARLFAGLSGLLSCNEHACLGVLAARPAGLTRTEWARATQTETQFEAHLPGRLVHLGLVGEIATAGEPRFSVTCDGNGVLAAAASCEAPAISDAA
jgi:integrase